MTKIASAFAKATLGLIILATASSCNQGTKSNTLKTTDSTGTNSTSASEKIVYINSDSLSAKYEYFKDIRTKLEAKVKKAQADLQAKGQAFQREVAEYQQKANTMSASDRQATEEKLARKQDELGRLDQNASSSIAQDEAAEFNNVYNAITEYLKKHAADNGYKFVLTYSKSNPTVLYADSSLEITNDVIAELNKDYKNKKPTEKK